MKTLIKAVVLVVLAGSAGAAEPSLRHDPPGCVTADQMPVFGVSVTGEGILRAYFRRVNTTDWCSVEGNNHGLASNVTLPKFEAADDIEYFFVLTQGRQIVARSEKIFVAKSQQRCETPIARHTLMLVMECAPPGAGGVPANGGAGFLLSSESPVSPFSPNQ